MATTETDINDLARAEIPWKPASVVCSLTPDSRRLSSGAEMSAPFGCR